MIIAYADQAYADLAAIADCLTRRNPTAALRLGRAIRAVIDGLARHPKRGRRQDSPGVRKLVEPRYGNLIYYHLDEPVSLITVLTIQHHAQDRVFGDV